MTGEAGLVTRWSVIVITALILQVGVMPQFQVLQMRRLLAMVVIAAGSAAGTLLYAVGGELFGEHTLSTPRLWTIVTVVALINGLLAPLALRPCRWAERRDDSAPVLGSIDV